MSLYRGNLCSLQLRLECRFENIRKFKNYFKNRRMLKTSECDKDFFIKRTEVSYL